MADTCTKKRCSKCSSGKGPQKTVDFLITVDKENQQACVKQCNGDNENDNAMCCVKFKGNSCSSSPPPPPQCSQPQPLCSSCAQSQPHCASCAQSQPQCASSAQSQPQCGSCSQGKSVPPPCGPPPPPCLPPNSLILPCGCLALFDDAESRFAAENRLGYRRTTNAEAQCSPKPKCTKDQGVCGAASKQRPAGCQTLGQTITQAGADQQYHCFYKPKGKPSSHMKVSAAGCQTAATSIPKTKEKMHPSSKKSSSRQLKRQASGKESVKASQTDLSKVQPELTKASQVDLSICSRKDISDSKKPSACARQNVEKMSQKDITSTEKGLPAASQTDLAKPSKEAAVEPMDVPAAKSSQTTVIHKVASLTNTKSQVAGGEEVSAKPSAQQPVPSSLGLSKIGVNVPDLGIEDTNFGISPSSVNNIVGDAERGYADARANASRTAKENLDLKEANVPPPIPVEFSYTLPNDPSLSITQIQSARSMKQDQSQRDVDQSKLASNRSIPPSQSERGVEQKTSGGASTRSVAQGQSQTGRSKETVKSNRSKGRSESDDEASGSSRSGGDKSYVEECAEGEDCEDYEDNVCDDEYDEYDDNAPDECEDEEAGDKGISLKKLLTFDWDTWDRFVSLLNGEPIPNPCMNRCGEGGGADLSEDVDDCDEDDECTGADGTTDTEDGEDCEDDAECGGNEGDGWNSPQRGYDRNCCDVRALMLQSDTQAHETIAMFIALPLVFLAFMASFRNCTN